MPFRPPLLQADEPDFNKTQRSTKEINLYLNLLNLLNRFDSGIEKICGRPPTPWVAWIHQIHVAGGESGSTTMVMLFVMLFVLFVQSRLVVVTRRM
jgi:hypothetical protein